MYYPRSGYARTYKKRYVKRKTAYRPRNGLVYSKGSNLVARIKRLEKNVGRKKVSLYTTTNLTDLETNINTPYTIQRLTCFSVDAPAFGTDPNDLLGSKVLLKSITCKCNVTLDTPPNPEEETQNVELYAVSLRDSANDLLNQTTGTLNNLSQGVHYYQYQGFTYINMKYFKVHAHKRWQLSTGVDISPGAQNLDGYNGRLDFKINVDKVIAAPSDNTNNQSWKAMTCSRDPSQNYFLIWFTDNSSLDTEDVRVSNLCIKRFEKLDN